MVNADLTDNMPVSMYIKYNANKNQGNKNKDIVVVWFCLFFLIKLDIKTTKKKAIYIIDNVQNMK